MESVVYKRTVNVGDKAFEVYMIKDYYLRRPEFPDALWGIEIVVDEKFYLAGWYENDNMVLGALEGIVAVFAMLQMESGQEADVDLSYFVRTGIVPKNELTGIWNPMPEFDQD